MAYRIEANCTYASTANRDTVRTNVANLLAGYSTTPLADRFPAGVVTSGTLALTVSIEVEDETTARAIGGSIVDILNNTIKHTTGFIGVYRIS